MIRSFSHDHCYDIMINTYLAIEFNLNPSTFARNAFLDLFSSKHAPLVCLKHGNACHGGHSDQIMEAYY